MTTVPTDTASGVRTAGQWFLARPNLQVLIDALRADGRQVIGPTVADGTIVLDEIERRRPAAGRLARRPGARALPADEDRERPALRLHRRSREPEALDVPAARAALGRRARRWVGRVPVGPRPRRPGSPSSASARASSPASASRTGSSGWAGRRRGLPRPTRRGPRRSRSSAPSPAARASAPRWARGRRSADGADLVLAELDDGFVIRSGARPARPSSPGCRSTAATRSRSSPRASRSHAVRDAIGRPVETDGLHDRLLAQLGQPALAADRRALPDVRELHARLPDLLLHERRPALRPRRRRQRATSAIWDSCFTRRLRARSPAATSGAAPQDRYRQWLTHKFATWIDQFGTFGCVGCGRCITWCPVGIDVRGSSRPSRRRSIPTLSADLAPRPRPHAGRADRDRPGVTLRASRETVDSVTLDLGDLDPALLGGRARPVRHGRPARLPARRPSPSRASDPTASS